MINDNHGFTGWGPQSIGFSCLKKVAEWKMVYGRYSKLVFMDVNGEYKPTYNWGAPSCRGGLIFGDTSIDSFRSTYVDI